MAAARAILLLALVALVSAVQEDTTGQQVLHVPGYTFGSNVGGYLRMSTDICDIKSAIGTTDTPGYAEAQAIYEDGKHSFKSDGSIRTLRGLATDSYAGEPIWDRYVDYFGGPDFLDQPVMDAFAGERPYTTVPVRNETIVKGIEAQLQTIYLLHELDEAADKIKAGNTDLQKGAPHNVDETWAIYTGLTPACSLWSSSQKRAMEFGTMLNCNTSEANAAMLEAHKRMYAAAVEGDLEAFRREQAEVVRLFMITYIQATLKYAELMDRAAAKGDKVLQGADQAEGYAFFRTIEPFVAAANNRSAATIRQALMPGNPAPANALRIVQPAIEAAYPRLGVTKADIGEFGNTKYASCPPVATTASLTGSTSVNGAAPAAAASPASSARSAAAPLPAAAGSLVSALLAVLLLALL